MQLRHEWSDVADHLAAEARVLCVVNTRADARTLASLVPGSIQLSALMCAEHRTVVLAEVQRRLEAGEDIRLVSTQLVEAGVDIDFPVVWRALAGIDSIAQAAGRCNREGRLSRGRVVVFLPPRPSPRGHLLQGEDATRSLLGAAQVGALSLGPDTYRRYFERLYAAKDGLDREGILPLLTQEARQLQVSFREAAERFQLIDDAGTTTAFVPYGKGAELIDALRTAVARSGGPDRRLLRRLQRHTVGLRQTDVRELERTSGLERITEDLVAVAPAFYGDLGVSVMGRDYSAGLSV
jgi:CRISPR-associated endonuclease/helicase Cas3